MATKYITQHADAPPNKQGSFWHEMKPFVKFGFKALGIMGGALIAIVKAIPKPYSEPKKSNTVTEVR